MNVIMFADRYGRELQPLTDDTCPAMLPVVNKPLIEHAIEAIAMTEMKAVTLVVGSHADQIRKLAGDGRRWGLAINFLSSRGEEDPEQFLQRQKIDLTAACLVLRGDMMRSACIDQFLRQAETVEGSVVHGFVGKSHAGLCLIRDGAGSATTLAWPSLAECKANQEPSVQIANARLSLIDSFQTYHSANMDAVSGLYPGLLIPGRQLDGNLVVGRGSRLFPQSLHADNAVIGQNCRVHDQAELNGNVVISDGSIIDKQASIKNAVILPHTYVGEMINLENAIVRSNDLIRVDSGTVVKVTDTFLLSDLKTSTLSDTLARPLNRLLGAAALVASLPLWPVAIIASLIERPRQLTETITLRGNRVAAGPMGARQRIEFVDWQWSTSIPVLRYLPRLIAAIKGHLSLVGASPLTPEQVKARVEDWEMLSDQAPAGLIGPTCLNVPVNAPVEEKSLSDAFYAKQRTTRGDLLILLKGLGALCSKRAWKRAA